MRQGGTIGGGTTEMARNVISERVLSMPRERRLDKDVPFRDVPRGRAGRHLVPVTSRERPHPASSSEEFMHGRRQDQRTVAGV